jgi:hypothetical protein
MVVVGQRHAPAALSQGKTRYLISGRLSGPQCQYLYVRKFAPPTGFDPRTFNPVASRYTKYAILAAFYAG